MVQASNLDRGATAIEYGLMIALIGVVIVAAVTLLGQGVIANFGRSDSALYSTLG